MSPSTPENPADGTGFPVTLTPGSSGAATDDELGVSLDLGPPGPQGDVRFTARGRARNLIVGAFLLGVSLGFVLAKIGAW